LSRGEIITLEDGRVIDGQQFIGPSRAGRKVIIGGDNDSAELLRHAAEGASVMIHESTHTETVKESLSWSARHSTASSVAKVAESAGVKNLILTHFSPRFSLKVPDGDDSSMTQLRDEAKKFYTGNLNLAQDFDIYSLDRENCLERTSARNRKTKPVS
jgi:ribonuclease Z